MSSRLSLNLFSSSLLPKVAHTLTGQGEAGTAGATGVPGTAGSVGVSGPTLARSDTSFGNQGVRQVPHADHACTASTVADSRALAPRTGARAEDQASQRCQAQSDPSDEMALPQFGVQRVPEPHRQSTTRVVPSYGSELFTVAATSQSANSALKTFLPGVTTRRMIACSSGT